MSEKISAKNVDLTLEDYKEFLFTQIETHTDRFDQEIIDNYKNIIEKLANNTILPELTTKARMLRVVKLLRCGIENLAISDEMKIIMFENSDIQVIFDIRLNGKYSILSFEITNKSSNPVNKFQVNIEDIPGIKVFSQKTECSLQPNETQKIELAILMIQPLYSQIRINFESDNINEYFPLPISISNFSTILPMDFETFIKRWNQCNNSKYHSQIDIPSQKNSAHTLAGLVNTSVSSPGAIMALENGTYFAAFSVEVNNSCSGALVRIFQERNGIIKIQVRSTSPDVAQTITKVVKQFCVFDD